MMNIDVTGIDPRYLRTDVRFRIFEIGQELVFDEPVFEDTIEVRWMQSPTDFVALTKDVQWNVPADARDVKAMSDAMLADDGFDRILVNKIRSTDDPGVGRTYVIQYQALKLRPTEIDYIGDGPEPSRALMGDIINKLEYLVNIKNPLSGVSSESTDKIIAMEEDRTGELADNYVADESHIVDVPNNRAIIRPTAGSFYDTDLAIVNVADSTTLVKGVDYTLFGLNRAKTRVASSTSGVFEYIFIQSPYVGELKVTYRAFGGDASLMDIKSIREILADVTQSLTDGRFVTADALAHSDSIVELISRVSELEYRDRHYVRASHRITADADGMHWFSVAELYRNQWDPETLVDGQLHLTLNSDALDCAYEFVAVVGLANIGKRLDLRYISAVHPSTMFTNSAYGNFEQRRTVYARLIWKETGGDPQSGCILQVGCEYTAGETLDFTIYDRSGNASDMVLYDNQTGDVFPNDDVITLPDGDVWTSIDDYSKVENVVLCPNTGYLAWGGAIPMNDLVDVGVVMNHVIEPDIDVKQVKRSSIYIYDRVDNRILVVDIPHEWDNNATLRGNALFYPDDLCSIMFDVGDGNVGYELRIAAKLGSHSVANERFDLRQLVFHM